MSLASVVLAVGAAVAMLSSVVAWRRHHRADAVLLAAGALAAAAVVSVILAGAVLVGGGAVFCHRRARAAAVVTRWGARSRRRHGVASTWDIVRVASFVAMRRRAATVRPSLAGLSRWARARVATTEVAVVLCRVGVLRVWASVEDVVCVFGRPRSGKSGWLGNHILDAPGAVLVTSTRTDLHDLTAGLRTTRGPVAVFNPTGLGDLPSTVTFDPLSGCADPVTASERAADLLSGAGATRGGDREYWAGQARRVLTALLHAAALGGLSMAAVSGWVANPDTAAREVLRLLRRSPSAAAYVPDAEQFLTTNDKTRSSITSTIMPCLGWLASPTALAATTGAAPLDVARWLASRGTVYLLGPEESQVAPLLAALTGHLARQARRIAARQPAGRLDPPARLVLDEAALVAPVPLHEWTSDMGGRGLQIIAAFQSRAQLVARWGDAAARVILNNTGATVLFSYGGDTDDLAHWSALSGHRDEAHATRDAHGRVTSRSARTVPTITPSQLTTLPRGHVVVFRHGMPVVVGRARMAWTRRDVKPQPLLTRAATRLTRAAAQAVATATEPLTHTAAQIVATATAHLARWIPRLRGRDPSRVPLPAPRPLTASLWAARTRRRAHRVETGTHPVGDPPPP